MAAAEMPWAAASFLKSASQRSKLPVLRQLASWAKAGAGTKAKTALMTALMRAAKRLALAAPAWPVVLTKTLYRIGLSAVVDDRAAVGVRLSPPKGPPASPPR